MTSTEDIMTAFTTEDPSSISAWATTEEEDYSDSDQLFCDRESVRAFRRRYEPPLFWIIAVVGGAGNMAVVWIYLNFRRRLKTKTDVYLLNLALADLLFLVTLPLWAAEAAAGGAWSFGPALCKLNYALYKVNLFSGALLLTCISADRYVVIVRSAKAQNSQAQRRRRSRLAVAGVWLLALLLATPELVFATVSDSDLTCRKVYPSHLGNQTKILVLALQVVFGFCLPFVVMAFCYSVIVATLLKTRSFQKHRAMRVILAVVAAFVATQLPYNAVLAVQAAQAANGTMACEEMKRFDTAGQVLKSLAYLHACLNPFLYAFVGNRFRKDVLQMLSVCRPRQRSLSANQSKSCRSSTRPSVMSDSDTSQALSL